MKGIIFTALLVSMFSGASYYEHNYIRKDCEVVQVGIEYVKAEDKCGYVWEFKGNEFKVGDKVDLKMYDNCTSDCISDDEVTDVVRK